LELPERDRIAFSELPMNPLLKEIRHNPLLWLLAFVPVLFAAQTLKPQAHTLLFVLSVLAIVRSPDCSVTPRNR
jgi:Ca2+:H+ antiporter